jgi:alpha-ribazole phosphatase
MLRLSPHDGATRLTLVRHLETDESLRGRAYGALDVPLSARGVRQAEQLASSLEALPLEAVYSSPLRRALETAGPVARRHGLEPIATEALRELDFGEVEGLLYEEVEANRPELFSSWMREPTRTTFPGGESFADLRARVLPAVEQIRTAHAGRAVAVVSHGGVIRTILADALALAEDAVFRLDQSCGGVSVVDWLGEVPLVRLVNATFPIWELHHRQRPVRRRGGARRG